MIEAGVVGRRLMRRVARGEGGDGIVILAGRTSVMLCERAGQDRCRVVIPSLDQPAAGTPVRVGIAGQPIIQGLAWVAGRVVAAWPDPERRGTAIDIELRRRSGLIPSVYDRVVRHRQREPSPPTEAQAGD